MGKHKDMERVIRKLKRKIEKLEEKTKGSSRSRSPRDRRKTRSPSVRSRSRHRSPRSWTRSRTRSSSACRRTETPSVSHTGHTRSPSVHSNKQQSGNHHVSEISQPLAAEAPETTPMATIEQDVQQQEVQQQEAEQCSEIDIDIISAMGTVEEEPVNGPPAHNEIAQRWTPILNKGLKKEDKVLLLKEYTPFHNIPSMVPPKLNPELSAAVSEPVKKRDIIIEYRQKNVAAALAAIGRGLECFMYYNKVEGIKKFNDAAKILCEIIYNETQSRRALVLSVINKEMKDSLQGSPDELLFGASLTERIKVAKAVQRSAQDLGNTVVKQNSVRANQRPLNSRVPPQPGYKRSGFNRMKNENQQGGGGKKAYYSQKKMRRPPQHQRERIHNPRK